MDFRDIQTLDDLKKVYPEHILERFPIAGKGEYYKDVSDKDWNNWIWQQKNRISTLEELEKIINVSDAEREEVDKFKELFYVSKNRGNDGV